MTDYDDARRFRDRKHGLDTHLYIAEPNKRGMLGERELFAWAGLEEVWTCYYDSGDGGGDIDGLFNGTWWKIDVKTSRWHELLVDRNEARQDVIYMHAFTADDVTAKLTGWAFGWKVARAKFKRMPAGNYCRYIIEKELDPLPELKRRIAKFRHRKL